MNNSGWSALQNGSDIRGIATEGIEGEAINLTPAIVEKIAIAFVSWLNDKKGISADKMNIAIGRDSRISGPVLMGAFTKGILSTGANSISCDISSTPAMYMSTIFKETKYDGAVMLTASHLPYNRNGIKFFTTDGGLEKKDITRILELAAMDVKPTAKKTGNESQFDLISAYNNIYSSVERYGKNRGGHAITLVGYDDSLLTSDGYGAFKFVNSWGTGWALMVTGGLLIKPQWIMRFLRATHCSLITGPIIHPFLSGKFTSFTIQEALSIFNSVWVRHPPRSRHATIVSRPSHT